MSEQKTTQPSSEVLGLAISSLERCEDDIYALVSEAAQQKDSLAVSTLNGLAQRVGQLRDSLGSDEANQSVPAMDAANTRETTRSVETHRLTKRRQNARPAGYPKFEIERNSLVKISWSKTKNSEYVHKAPKRVLDRLVEVMLELGGKGEVVSTDQMFPLEVDGNQFPDYQSYICLLWLKQSKLVLHHGREGYEIRDLETFVSECKQLWDELGA